MTVLMTVGSVATVAGARHVCMVKMHSRSMAVTMTRPVGCIAALDKTLPAEYQSSIIEELYATNMVYPKSRVTIA